MQGMSASQASKKNKSKPNLDLEIEYFSKDMRCVGVDEVGRGCLAGPVVTAAVVLPDCILEGKSDLEMIDERPWWTWINDSKLLAPRLREVLSGLILKHSQVQIAWCFPEEIDRWNILHASMIAMRRAVWPFAGMAQIVLVDGNMDPFEQRFRCQEGLAERLGFQQVETLVKGDQRSLSIAAASVVAKVYRDKWMTELETIFPGYGFGEHKGYSTPAHYRAIEKLGSCPIHRMSFAPFKNESDICKKPAHERRTGQQTRLDLR